MLVAYSVLLMCTSLALGYTVEIFYSHFEYINLAAVEEQGWCNPKPPK